MCVARHIKQAFAVPSVIMLAMLHQSLAVAESAPEWIYTVRPYDTLIQFANLHLINPDDWRKLQTLNQIKNPYRIPAGSKIRVPLDLVKQGPVNAQVDSIIGEAYLIKANQSKQLLTAGQ
ncbi:MAG TPA: LysM peptidoglycan-binding domain-containing protein [Methylophilus sp.]